jgi:hypothetical protein
MKKFLAIYTGGQADMDRWNKLSKDERDKREAEGIKAWMAWGEKHAKVILDQGNPLGRTKSVGPKGISDIRNALTGYVLLEAETHEAAAKLFEGHPHFAIFPGDGVEIMECLPLPPQ